MKNLDSFKSQYAYSKAAQTLADILDEMGDELLFKKVLRFLKNYHTMLKTIEGIEKSSRLHLMELIYKDFKNTIDVHFSNKNEKIIKSLFINVITAINRKKYHEINKTVFYLKKYKSEWKSLLDTGVKVKEIAKSFEVSNSKVRKILNLEN